jgi:nicotinate-nucleotide adenylyltransferase
LSERYPEKSFVLLMGSDNLMSINKWKNWEQLLSAYDIMVYPRPGYEDVALEKEKLKRTTTVKGVPLMQISSTFIRSAIKNKKDIRFMLPESVYRYIDEMNLYKK